MNFLSFFSKDEKWQYFTENHVLFSKLTIVTGSWIYNLLIPLSNHGLNFLESGYCTLVSALFSSLSATWRFLPNASKRGLDAKVLQIRLFVTIFTTARYNYIVIRNRKKLKCQKMALINIYYEKSDQAGSSYRVSVQ